MCRKPPFPESADKSQRSTWLSGREKGRVLCTPSGDSDLPPLEEEEVALPDSENVKDTVAIKLPGRRTLQIQFTCNSCGTRSRRLLNPFAFKRGTVFVQCAGCQKYHQLVDNLGLIKEYDFREERRQDGIAKDEDSGKVPPEGS